MPPAFDANLHCLYRRRLHLLMYISCGVTGSEQHSWKPCCAMLDSCCGHNVVGPSQWLISKQIWWPTIACVRLAAAGPRPEVGGSPQAIGQWSGVVACGDVAVLAKGLDSVPATCVISWSLAILSRGTHMTLMCHEGYSPCLPLETP